ncbi:Phophatidylinositol-4-phosphate 5-kinase [Giardia duodenalis]|uniref:Phophatidylinositol-4-phosphate 5-kinase n=1 Tax=Giardia intestinalis TaxID=5741 RepID=V6TGL7_GIAIN|nr:Phophatidylinositol-4-phosphate 5-kinase [Giardia intestinalis]
MRKVFYALDSMKEREEGSNSVFCDPARSIRSCIVCNAHLNKGGKCSQHIECNA